MQQIFTARNDMEAHFVKGLIEQAGIQVMLQGESLEGAWGDLPLSDTALPGLWVDDADAEKAAPIIADYRQREQKIAKNPDAAPVGSTWKCPKCGQDVEEQFDECWNCGADKPQ